MSPNWMRLNKRKNTSNYDPKRGRCYLCYYIQCVMFVYDDKRPSFSVSGGLCLEKWVWRQEKYGKE